MFLTFTGCATSNGTWAVGQFYPSLQSHQSQPSLALEFLDPKKTHSLKEQYEHLAHPDKLTRKEFPFQEKSLEAPPNI